MKKIKQVQGVVFYKNKIVLVKKFDARFGKSFWRLPKGKLEKGENAVQGLKRELKEEIGVSKTFKHRKVYSYAYQSPKGTVRMVDCYAVVVKQKPKQTADARHEGIEKAALALPSFVLKKLRWPAEKKSVIKALAYFGFLVFLLSLLVLE